MASDSKSAQPLAQIKTTIVLAGARKMGRAMTVAVAARNVSAAPRAVDDALLPAPGSVEWVEDENLTDAVTAVPGSGPAYILLPAEELARAGVEARLPPEIATSLARELL